MMNGMEKIKNKMEGDRKNVKIQISNKIIQCHIFKVQYSVYNTNAETILTFGSIPPHPTLSPQGRGETEVGILTFEI
jgi:hypothetical protein